jgi:hypothetical protein
MATYVPAKKNTAYITYVGLVSKANASVLQANPTLAAGDVKVAIDDGAPANLATLPVVDADFTKRVKVSLSAAEMNGDNISIIFSDAAGDEWCDLIVNIQTGANQIDDLATSIAAILVDTDTTIPGLITAASPSQHVSTANTENGNTTLDGGTFADTATNDDATYYQTGPGVAVGGFGLNCVLTFGIGTGRVPSTLTVDGHFDSGAQRTVQVWAYDYILAAYVQLSNSATDFGNFATDTTRQYAMNPTMQNITTGEVLIRFTSTSVTIADVWELDFCAINSVAAASAGLTADAIQAAVWNRSHSGHDEETLGYVVGHTFLLQGDIVSATSGSQFILDAGVATNDAYNGMEITLEDKTDDHYETRVIIDYIGATNEVFVDRAFSFTPVAGDDYYILNGTGTDSTVVDKILDLTYVLSGQIVSVTSKSQFILDDGAPTDNAYNGMTITLDDNFDHYESRQVVDYIGATKEIFVNTDFSFTPITGDDYYIMNGSYLPVGLLTLGQFLGLK